ncbi:MAG: RagB/SusD family nutrient uptake outer membrane protein [Porphyromonas sp.]|nr:RagB/SusD family nutrient uptake outer membrane protein [Porphyromonas sp.]
MIHKRQRRLQVALFTILIAGIFSACDFLNVTPKDKVTSKVVYETYDNAVKALRGLYDKMMLDAEGFMIVMQTSSLHNFFTSADLMGQDVIIDPTQIQGQGDDYNYASRTSDQSRTEFAWSYPYKFITVANDMIAQAPNMQGKEHEKLAFEAEARAIRAFHYHLLVQWFQQTYLIDPEAPAVPLYLTPTAEEQPRATMREVYTAMEEDLAFAVEHLPEVNRSGDNFVLGRDAARGLLVRILMEMGRYEEALPHAKILATKYPPMSKAEYMKGFADNGISECIWALCGSPRNFGASFSNLTIWTQPERRHGRWARKFIFIDSDFYDLFSPTDYRRELIMENTADYSTTPEKKYYTNKLNDPIDEAHAPDLIVMRGSEMLLCQAECEARTGATAQAQATLTKLVQARDSEAPAVQATGEELIKRIWIERRKELFGEGFALHDLKRFRYPLVRKGNHTIRGEAATGILYPKDDYHFVLQIPSQEIEVNKLIIQNK